MKSFSLIMLTMNRGTATRTCHRAITTLAAVEDPPRPPPSDNNLHENKDKNKSTDSQQKKDEKTHFGERTVTHEEKRKLVGEVFSNVADKYDLMNDLMSGTLHRTWKDSFVEEIDPIAWPNIHTKILDVAGGTGDVSFRIAEKCQERLLGLSSHTSSAKITVCDINPDMLRVGKQRQPNFGSNVNLDWLEGDAETLDALPDDEFDLYTIAFGIRNVPRIDRALKTAFRVLKPGGRLSVLEFSRVSAGPFVEQAYKLYSDAVIPAMGQVVAGDANSYKYLVESIRKFPAQREFERMIRDAGFDYVRHRNMSFGIVAMHTGFKPPKIEKPKDEETMKANDLNGSLPPGKVDIQKPITETALRDKNPDSL
jgi:ubiquinone/menaquinone biosynthesis methyltransferase